MIEPAWFFWGLVLPAAISAVVLYLWSRGFGTWQWAGAGWSLAVVPGFVAGYVATYGWPKIPPIESQEWVLVVLVPVAAAISAVAAWRGRGSSAIWAARWLVAVCAAPLLLQPYLKHQWSGMEALLWLAGIGVAVAGQWVSLAGLEARSSAKTEGAPKGGWFEWVLAGTAGGTGVVILLSGSQTLGQLGLTLACVLAAGGVAGWFGPCPEVRVGRTDVPVVVLIGLWMSGYFYAELAILHVILLMLAPHAAWVGDIPKIRRMPPWQGMAIRLLAVGGVVLAAVILAVVKFRQEAMGNGYG